MSISLSGSLLITGSLTATGTLTAQTLVVQTVTSSIVYSSGSNIFGNQLTDVQQMTGSLRVTGSLSLNNIAIPTSASLASTYLPLAGGTLTGALSGTSATFSAGITSVGGSNQEIIASATGDFFPRFKLIRTAGTTKTNRNWSFDLGTNGTLFLEDNTAGASRLSIDTTGAATFSSTISAGAATFSGKVIGNGFNSFSGTNSIASSATSTIYTMDSNGLYTVQIIVTGGSLIYSAAAIFYAHANNNEFLKCIDLYDGANVTLDQSAGAIRITNNGFATLTWAWSVLYQRF